MARICKSRKSTHSIMSNGGNFGPVIIVSQGVKRLTLKEQSMMTIEQAMKAFEGGLDITVA